MEASSPAIDANHRNASAGSHPESAGASEYTRDGHTASVTSGSTITANTQCLRFETITDRESRRAVLVMKLVVVLGDAGTSIMVSVRRLRNASDLFIMNRRFMGVAVAINALFFLSLVLGFAMWSARIWTSYRRGMKWTKRRTGVVQLTLVRGALVLTIVTGQLALSIYHLTTPSAFCRSRYVTPLIDLVIWLCWGTVLLALLIEAHGTNLILKPTPDARPQRAPKPAEAQGATQTSTNSESTDGAKTTDAKGADCAGGDAEGPAAIGADVKRVSIAGSEAQGVAGDMRRARGKGAVRSDGVVFDLPLYVHWPKLFVWVPFTVSVVWGTALAMDDGNYFNITVKGGGACTWGAKLECSVSSLVWGVGMTTYVCVGVYFLLYAAYLYRGSSLLRRVTYQKYRMANLVHRLQIRFNAVMMGGLFVGLTLTAFTTRDPCVSYATTLLGNPPISLIFVALQLVAFYLSFPRRHDFLESQRRLPTLLLQQFAWTEADLPRRRAARAAALNATPFDPPSPAGTSTPARPPLSAAAPLFCFETAIKLFFWSVLVYSYQEGPGPGAAVSLATMPAPIRELLGEMDAAMRLFGLTKRRLFYDREHGTKVLVAWNDSVIVVSFRGTKEAANLIQDAKMFQTAHPPRRKFRGRVPGVHQGFLATWHAPGMHGCVMPLLRELLTVAPNPDQVRVLCTGHSLGGAVAQLASFDIVRDLGVAPERISCYTFGCPRIGNRALAAEFDEVVPDTWHIINDQDIVTRGMKMWGLYKRAGQRVNINRHGDLIVRPAHFEVSLLQSRFFRASSAPQHATTGYQRALVAIITAQLQDSSRHADGLHGLLGLLKQLPQVRQALESHAQTLGTALPDLLRKVVSAAVPLRGASATLDAPGLASSSRRLTASRRDSLLRAAGALPVVVAGGDSGSDDGAEVIPVAAGSGGGASHDRESAADAVRY